MIVIATKIVEQKQNRFFTYARIILLDTLIRTDRPINAGALCIYNVEMIIRNIDQ